MNCFRPCFPCYAPDGDFIDHFTEGLSSTPLRPEETSYIHNRYLTLVREAANEACVRSWQFHLLVNIITLSGILITTLTPLSTSTKVSDTSKDGLYWTIMVLGAVLTIANKWIYLFGIHKKYILTQQALERYEAEGWHFIAAVGRYHRPEAERFKVFCDRVEKIQAKKVQEMVAVNASTVSAAGIGVTPRADDASIIGSPTPRVVPPQHAASSVATVGSWAGRRQPPSRLSGTGPGPSAAADNPSGVVIDMPSVHVDAPGQWDDLLGRLDGPSATLQPPDNVGPATSRRLPTRKAQLSVDDPPRRADPA